MGRVSASDARKASRFLARLRAGARNRDGLAATEFALILPVLTLIFFGMLETSDALMANRRVANASNALVDLVGQERRVTPEQLDEIFLGVARMLEPRNTSTLSMRLASVSQDPDDASRILVDWSRDNDGLVPYAPGSEFTKLGDNTVLMDGMSLVVAEMTYNHVSGLTNHVLGSPITLNRMAVRWPRRSMKVLLCTTNPSDPQNPICPT